MTCIEYFGGLSMESKIDLAFLESDYSNFSKKFAKILDLKQYASISLTQDEYENKIYSQAFEYISKLSPNLLFVEGNADKESLWCQISHNFNIKLTFPDLIISSSKSIKSKIVKSENKQMYFVGIPEVNKYGQVGVVKAIKNNKWQLRKISYGIMPTFSLDGNI